MHLRRAFSRLLFVGLSVAATTTSAPVAASESPSERPLAPLVRSVTERLATADAVAAAKWGTDQPVEAPEREREILDAVARKSAEMGIDPRLARRVFRDQIEANKLVQHALHGYWASHPDARPVERPDLDEIRPIIDRINQELLTLIRTTKGVRADPSCVGRLTGAYFHITHELDALHRAGVGRALPSVCTEG